jgi:hypothetical protein
MPGRRVPPPAPELIQFLRAYPREIAELFFAIRAEVLDEAPDATETIWDAYNAVADGFSYTGKLSDTFIHIAAYSQHVNLGLNQGASLPDPDGVLEGTGNQVRHIKITSIDDLKQPHVRHFIKLAHESVPKPAGAKRGEPLIREMNSGRRRPDVEKKPGGKRS